VDVGKIPVPLGIFVALPPSALWPGARQWNSVKALAKDA